MLLQSRQVSGCSPRPKLQVDASIQEALEAAEAEDVKEDAEAEASVSSLATVPPIASTCQASERER